MNEIEDDLNFMLEKLDVKLSKLIMWSFLIEIDASIFDLVEKFKQNN